MISEYWSDGPNSEQPPGHWMLLAEWVSARDHHTLDDEREDVLRSQQCHARCRDRRLGHEARLRFRSPGNRHPLLYGGKKIRAWGGPAKGTVEMDGTQWMPYQLATNPTPPFPDYVSGHSTYSAAAAYVLTAWTGSDRFGDSVTIAPGSSKIEPGVTPAHPLTLKWRTFTEAADEAGMSRRYGGIHFRRADLAGRELGRLVSEKAWLRAQDYFDGPPKPKLRRATVNEPTEVDTKSGH